MLYKLEIIFDRRNFAEIDHSFSAKLHGLIMDVIEGSIANALHEPSLKPYSQSICLNEENVKWNIYGLNDYIYNNVLSILYEKKTFYIKAINKEIEVLSSKLEKKSFDEFFKESYERDSKRLIKINFRTVTAFKSQGKYINYPDLRLILQSIMKKFDEFMEENIFDETILEHFLESVTISQYNIRSARYNISGVHIPGFIGSINYYIKGPQQLVNLFDYLFSFAEYSGVGIKNALGMGKIEKGGRL